MCLYIVKEKNEKLKKRFKKLVEQTGKKNPSIIAWKVFNINFDSRSLTGKINFNLSSLYMSGRHYGPGFIFSDRPKKKKTHQETWNSVIERGIHVFVDRESAQKIAQKFTNRSFDQKVIIIPVRCYYRDFVAAGENFFCTRNEAVFMKVEITKHAWKKVTRDWQDS